MVVNKPTSKLKVRVLRSKLQSDPQRALVAPPLATRSESLPQLSQSSSSGTARGISTAGSTSVSKSGFSNGSAGGTSWAQSNRAPTKAYRHQSLDGTRRYSSFSFNACDDDDDKFFRFTQYDLEKLQKTQSKRGYESDSSTADSLIEDNDDNSNDLHSNDSDDAMESDTTQDDLEEAKLAQNSVPAERRPQPRSAMRRLGSTESSDEQPMLGTRVTSMAANPPSVASRTNGSPPGSKGGNYRAVFLGSPNQHEADGLQKGNSAESPQSRNSMQYDYDIWELDDPNNSSFWEIDSDYKSYLPPLLVPRSENHVYRTPVIVNDTAQYPWTDEVHRLRREVFHLDNFRPNQLPAINAALSNKDVLVIMPTGGGKSLCYQLPALISAHAGQGVTVVISPLLALITDQIQSLRARGIRATCMTSRVLREERKEIIDQIKNKQLDLLYLAPEMFFYLFIPQWREPKKKIQYKDREAIKITRRTLAGRYRQFRAKGVFARVILDEAHCIRWDFRTLYKCTRYIKDLIPGTPIMALTATATSEDRRYIMDCFRTPTPVTLELSYYRPNIFMEIRLKRSRAEVDRDIMNMIKTEFCGQAGIIYCFSRRSCENLCQYLTDNGIKSGFFHSTATGYQKDVALNFWRQNKLQVICATTAFGMGIDKPDVRFVIYHVFSRDISEYYQGSGRSGRDGKPSRCIMYHSLEDFLLISALSMSNNLRDAREQRKRLQGLRSTHGFSLNFSACRHALILKHFGEKPPFTYCDGMCDNCAARHSQADASVQRIELDNLTKEMKLKYTPDQFSPYNFRGTELIVGGSFLVDLYGIFTKFNTVPSDITDKVDKIIHEDIFLRIMRNARDPGIVNFAGILAFCHDADSLLLHGFLLDFQTAIML